MIGTNSRSPTIEVEVVRRVHAQDPSTTDALKSPARKTVSASGIIRHGFKFQPLATKNELSTTYMSQYQSKTTFGTDLGLSAFGRKTG